MRNKVEALFLEGIREGRTYALDAAIELCERISEGCGHAACCVEEIKLLRDSMIERDQAADARRKAMN